MDAKIENLLAQMSLEEKASLCSGADAWHTRAIERLGIPAIRMTDGPHGVRRPYPDDSTSVPANCFPTASAMAATWNVDLTRRVGEALGKETRSKGCHILLGPAVNIHRTPLCGRNFEYYSEDPHLAGRMAVAYIQGLQSQGAGASLKHYALNNAEFERFSMSSEVSERAMREIYLPAFEAAVKEADPWTIMCSYNKINGTWASENHMLLTEILRKEWGFKGLVVSDWGAVHSRILSSQAGLDLEMPGVGPIAIKILVGAVQRGLVDEAILDEMVRRILRVVWLAHADGRAQAFEPEAARTPENTALAREAAGEAVVLLKNEGGLLPFDADKIRTLAVIGPAAAAAGVQGGGSAHVNPYYTVSPLEGIRSRAGKKIVVEYTQGCLNRVTPPALDARHVLEPGFQAAYYANDAFAGEPVATRVESLVRLSLEGLPQDLTGGVFTARWSGAFVAPVSGEYVFGVTSAGRSRVLVNGDLVANHWDAPDLAAFMSIWPFQSKFGSVRLEAGKPCDLVVEYESLPGQARLSASCDIPLPVDEWERAARIAARADAVVVCVGTTWEQETEGYDQANWDLPGDQARLIEVVAKANPKTVVVLTNGSPLGMAAWIRRVPAVVEGWFNGQETGNAIAGVLFGDINPSGKLPDTFPVHYQDTPAFINYPGENGKLYYGEGLFVGYRYYDMRDLEPLFPFGYGLSYTTFAYENLVLSKAEIETGVGLEVRVDVRNTGSRAGKEVVQLYLRDLASRLVRPPKELKGFQKVALAPGEVKTLAFSLAERDLAYYDPSVPGWVAEPGEFDVLVGASSRDIRASARFTLKGGPVAARPRLNLDTPIGEILADQRGAAVLRRHLPDLIESDQLGQFSWASISRISVNFMDLLPTELLRQIEAELGAEP